MQESIETPPAGKDFTTPMAREVEGLLVVSLPDRQEPAGLEDQSLLGEHVGWREAYVREYGAGGDYPAQVIAKPRRRYQPSWRISKQPRLNAIPVLRSQPW